MEAIKSRILDMFTNCPNQSPVENIHSTMAKNTRVGSLVMNFSYTKDIRLPVGS